MYVVEDGDNMTVFIDSTNEIYTGIKWHLEFNLKWICENAGKRETVYSYEKHKNISYVAYPMNKAKKALRLCYLGSDDDKREEIKDFLSKYPKMLKIWEELR